MRVAQTWVEADPAWFEYRPDPVIVHPDEYARRERLHRPECGAWLAPGPASADFVCPGCLPAG